MLQQPTIPDDAGWLIQQVEKHGLGHFGALKVFMEAGLHETRLYRVSS